MRESEDPPRRTDADRQDDPPAEPAPPLEESRTPPHGDPLADEADEDEASSRGGMRD